MRRLIVQQWSTADTTTRDPRGHRPRDARKSMTRAAAHVARWRAFEVVVGVPIGVAVALHVFIPWSFPSATRGPAVIAVGAALLLSGLALVILARRALRAQGPPTDPGRPSLELVTTGVFSVSRNPLYGGGIATLAGLGVLFDSPWTLVLLVPAVVACHVLLVMPEERYLANRFGQDYRSYAAKVRRWIGRNT